MRDNVSDGDLYTARADCSQPVQGLLAVLKDNQFQTLAGSMPAGVKPLEVNCMRGPRPKNIKENQLKILMSKLKEQHKKRIESIRKIFNPLPSDDNPFHELVAVKKRERNNQSDYTLYFDADLKEMAGAITEIKINDEAKIIKLFFWNDLLKKSVEDL